MTTVPDVVDRVQAAVLAVPGVADLHAGAFGEAATYLPGRRVAGVQLRDDVTRVHIAVRFGHPVRGTAAAVRAAVAPLVRTPVHVVVQDVVEDVADDEVRGDRP